MIIKTVEAQAFDFDGKPAANVDLEVQIVAKSQNCVPLPSLFKDVKGLVATTNSTGWASFSLNFTNGITSTIPFQVVQKSNPKVRSMIGTVIGIMYFYGLELLEVNNLPVSTSGKYQVTLNKGITVKLRTTKGLLDMNGDLPSYILSIILTSYPPNQSFIRKTAQFPSQVGITLTPDVPLIRSQQEFTATLTFQDGYAGEYQLAFAIYGASTKPVSFTTNFPPKTI